jgi:hypothetical protein
MGRRERPLVRGAGDIERFAADLRELRQRSGLPTYRELARRAHFGISTLSQAAAGHRLPSLEVTLAYVRACGATDEIAAEWAERWAQLTHSHGPMQPRSRQSLSGATQRLAHHPSDQEVPGTPSALGVSRHADLCGRRRVLLLTGLCAGFATGAMVAGLAAHMRVALGPAVIRLEQVDRSASPVAELSAGCRCIAVAVGWSGR